MPRAMAGGLLGLLLLSGGCAPPSLESLGDPGRSYVSVEGTEPYREALSARCAASGYERKTVVLAGRQTWIQLTMRTPGWSEAVGAASYRGQDASLDAAPEEVRIGGRLYLPLKISSSVDAGHLSGTITGDYLDAREHGRRVRLKASWDCGEPTHRRAIIG